MKFFIRFATITLSLATLTMVLTSAAQSQPDVKSDWVVLFDGKSLDAWRGFKRNTFPDYCWTNDNGAIKAIVITNSVDLITKEKFSDFELQLEWKISPGGNSGVMYRVTEQFKLPWHTGAEYQILDDLKHSNGKNPKTSAGAVYDLLAPGPKKLNTVGEWNQTRIIVKGSHVEHWLNGAKILEYDSNGADFTALVAASKFKDKPRFMKEPAGHICLQNHHNEVWFKNIRIRRL